MRQPQKREELEQKLPASLANWLQLNSFLPQPIGWFFEEILHRKLVFDLGLGKLTFNQSQLVEIHRGEWDNGGGGGG